MRWPQPVLKAPSSPPANPKAQISCQAASAHLPGSPQPCRPPGCYTYPPPKLPGARFGSSPNLHSSQSLMGALSVPKVQHGTDPAERSRQTHIPGDKQPLSSRPTPHLTGDPPAWMGDLLLPSALPLSTKPLTDLCSELAGLSVDTWLEPCGLGTRAGL